MNVLPQLLVCLTVFSAPDVVDEVAAFYRPFVDTSRLSHTDAYGLYAAIDPVASRQRGACLIGSQPCELIRLFFS